MQAPLKLQKLPIHKISKTILPFIAITQFFTNGLIVRGEDRDYMPKLKGNILEPFFQNRQLQSINSF